MTAIVTIPNKRGSTAVADRAPNSQDQRLNQPADALAAFKAIISGREVSSALKTSAKLANVVRDTQHLGNISFMYLRHVDGLRAVAVLGVLMAHFALPFGHGGFLGVDVFFVISGFLITRLIAFEQLQGSFSFKRFYIRRGRRLLPAALSVIGLSLFVFLPILGEKDLASFLKSVPFSVLPLANIHFYQEVGYFDVAASAKPLLHFWSLAVEEQFYFFWPTILLIGLRIVPRALGGICLGLLLLSLGASDWFRSQDFSAVYYLLPFRAFELLVGGQLALWMRKDTGARAYEPEPEHVFREGVLGVLGLVMVLGSYFAFTEQSPLPGALSLIPCVGAVLLIRFGSTGPVGWILRSRIAVWIGLISYSLYLVHWPLFVYISYRLPDVPSLWLKAALFPAAIALAALNYYLVEKPLRRPAPEGRRWGNFPAFMGMAACVLVIISPTVWKKFNPAFGVRTAQADSIDSTKAFTVSRIPWDGSPTGAHLSRYTPSVSLPVNTHVLLIGDSHAGHLVPGLSQLLAPQGIALDVATLAGCPPLFGAVRYYDAANRSREQRRCAVHDGHKLTLATDQRYDAVILAGRWTTMFEDSDFGMLANRADRLVTPEALSALPTIDPEVSLAASRALFPLALETTLTSLVEAKKKVIVIGPIPEPGQDLTRCMRLFPWSMKSGNSLEAGRCAQLDSATIRDRVKYSNETIADAAAPYEEVLAVLPSQVLCGDTANPCMQVDLRNDAELMFRDSHHLSKKGSVIFARRAEDQLGLVEFLKSGNLSE